MGLSQLPVPSTMLPLLSTPLLSSMLLLSSMPPSMLPPCTVEPDKCPTSQCPSLTRASTGPPPSPRPSEPPAGGDLPSLDMELSSVKKLLQQPCRRPLETT